MIYDIYVYLHVDIYMMTHLDSDVKLLLHAFIPVHLLDLLAKTPVCCGSKCIQGPSPLKVAQIGRRQTALHPRT